MAHSTESSCNHIPQPVSEHKRLATDHTQSREWCMTSTNFTPYDIQSKTSKTGNCVNEMYLVYSIQSKSSSNNNSEVDDNALCNSTTLLKVFCHILTRFKTNYIKFMIAFVRRPDQLTGKHLVDSLRCMSPDSLLQGTICSSITIYMVLQNCLAMLTKD